MTTKKLFVTAITLFLCMWGSKVNAHSTEEIAANLMPSTLLAAQIKSNIGYELSTKFIDMLGLGIMPGKAAKQDRYSEQEIKNMLEEVDRIITTATAPIDNLVSAKANDIRSDQVSEFVFYKDQWEGMLANKAAIEWVKKNNEFQVKTASLGYLSLVLWAIAPNRIPPPFTVASIEYKFLVGELFASQREKIFLMLNTESAVAVLPKKFDVSRLKTLEAEIRTSAKPLLISAGYIKGLDGLDGPIFRTSLRFSDRLVSDLQPFAQRAVAELKVLAQKYR